MLAHLVDLERRGLVRSEGERWTLARLKTLPFWLPPLLALLVGGGLGLLLRPAAGGGPGRRPASRSPTRTLLSVREQGRQTVFAARFVADGDGERDAVSASPRARP